MSPRNPLLSTIAILISAAAGPALDTATAHTPSATQSTAVVQPTAVAQSTAAAQSRGPADSATPAARTVARSAARLERRSHGACRAWRSRRSRRKGHAACHSHKLTSPKLASGKSHTARNHPVRRAQTGEPSRMSAPKPVSASPESGPSIASALATPCENTELTPEPGNVEAIDAATLCLINQERARNDELPLQPNPRLQQAAQGHSEEMVSENYFAHVAPSGLTPVGRVEDTGYLPNGQVGYTLGENIAWATLQLSTPDAIVAAWISSPEHLANILYSPYRDTAIGIVPKAPASLAEGQPGAVYTQEFGVIVG